MIGKVKKVTIILICAAFVFLTCMTAVFFHVSSEIIPEYTIEDFSNEYELNGTLKIPKGLINLDGKEYKMKSVVTYPDGRCTEYDDITLDAVGEYTVRYSYEYNGETYSTEKKFNVVRTTANQFINIDGCQFTYGVQTPSIIDKGFETQGVKLHASKMNSQFKYNGIINLKQLGVNKPFIEFLFTPETNGKNETESVIITLTDIHNPNNYVVMAMESNVNYGPYESTSVITFCVNDMYKPFGICENDTTANYYGSKPYSGTYSYMPAGTITDCSFFGKYTANNYYRPLPLYFDVNENEVWCKNRNLRIWNKKWKMFDFDDRNIVSSNVWNGFTTGEVYMDITVNAMPSGSNILFTTINGMSLAGKNIEADDELNLSIDYDGYDENNLPCGKSGENNSYPIFDAIAYSSIEGILNKPEIAVYYGVKFENVPIDCGRFSTKKEGDYFIVYSSSTTAGKTIKKTIKIKVYDQYDTELNFIFDDRIQSEIIYGIERVNLYVGTAVGGNGNIDIKTSVLFNEKEVELKNDGNLFYFEPKSVGVYILKHTLTDIAGTVKTVEKEIEVVENGYPVIEDIYIPDAIRANYFTEFPDATAYITENGVKKSVAVKIEVDDVEISGWKYKPSTAGEIMVKYSATSSNDPTKISSISKKVKVLDINEDLFYSSFLLADGLEINSNSSDNTKLVYDYNATTLNAENPSLYFANKLNHNNFNITFDFLKNKGDVDKVRITLFSARDKNNVVCLDVVNDHDYPVLYNNGIRLGEMAGAFNRSLANQISLNYVNGTKTITDSIGTKIGKVLYTSDGRIFNGFDSGVYCKVEIITSSANVSFCLCSINNQTFSLEDSDWLGPNILFDTPMAERTFIELGQNVTIFSAYAMDVIGDAGEVKVEITAPDKTIVYSGLIASDYSFTVNQLGQYIIKYTTNDDSGNYSKLNKYVEGIDSIPPVISDKVVLDKTEFKVGEKITLPAFDASDNSGETVKYYLIIDSNFEYHVCNSAEYKFTKKGEYRIRFTAIDNCFNTSFRELTVVVK